MVWIQCKTGEYLDPKNISSIRVLPCYGCPDEVEIFAEYAGHSFLLFRTSVSSLKEMGVRNNQEKFRTIISEIEKKHEESNSLTFEDIFNLIIHGDHEYGKDLKYT